MNPATIRVSSDCSSVCDKSVDKVPAVFTCTDLVRLSKGWVVEIKKTKILNVYFFMLFILNICLLLSFSASALSFFTELRFSLLLQVTINKIELLQA